MKKSNVLTIDIGTQSTRAAVVAATGEILGIEQILHDTASPHPGWAEQRPDQWWEESCRAIRRVFDKTGADPRSIAAVANCGQMHGPVGIDEKGEVATEWVQLWCDKRCISQVETIRKEQKEGELLQKTASPLNTAWTAIKVRWEKESRPDSYARARHFLVPKDFINFRLTGVAASDHSEASLSYIYDCRTGDYTKELADAVGVDIDKFAPIHRSHEVIGTVTQSASNATGIPDGTPVVAGGGDFPVSMLGFGIVGENRMADVTGTSSLLAVHSKKPLIDPAIQNCRHVVDGWIPFTILDCGGVCMKWCKDLFGFLPNAMSYDDLIERARLAPAASEGLFFFPYMRGERRYENVNSRGGFFGLTLEHETEHLIRSVMEGVAYAMAKDAEFFRSRGLALNKLRSVGGGTRNELWNEIKASVLDLPVEISMEPEAGIKGCALLGAAGVGLVGDPSKASVARETASRTVKPNSSDARLYKAAQLEFNRIYAHMFGFWQSS